ncbi:Transcriptional regulator TrmB [mine drainage metagenome]|uniref:Transcriptional regulator TrmB n=1 Tax=mine drainage metagenome TaxID=410659 RepID=T1BKC8_9ZZZZ
MEATSDRITRVQEMLKLLGLSSYEAQGFAALVYHNAANADTIADTAKIPRTSAYKVMESLVQKGFAKETDGRPKMFKLEVLNNIKERFQEELKELFIQLKDLQDIMPSKGDPQLIYTIYGKTAVIEKLAELINLADNEIYICTPRVKDIRTELKKNLDNAIKRGVNVVFVTPPNKRVPQNAKVFRKEGLIATDIVVDRSKALIAGPDLDACGFSDNPGLSMHVYQFIQMIIERNQ